MSPPPLRIELDLFSGRPNPGWELTAAEAEELGRRFAERTRCESPPEPPGLGYRGFEIHSPGRAGLPSRLRVYRGVLTVIEDEGTRHYCDERELERWLADLAQARGYPSLEVGPR